MIKKNDCNQDLYVKIAIVIMISNTGFGPYFRACQRTLQLNPHTQRANPFCDLKKPQYIDNFNILINVKILRAVNCFKIFDFRPLLIYFNTMLNK